MAAQGKTASKMQKFVERIHYVKAAADSRRRAKKRAIGSRALRWEDNLHGRSTYDRERPARLLFITNWPLLNHLGITSFVQLAEKPRAARRRIR